MLILLQVADDSSQGVLNIADTVTAVMAKSFDNSADLIKYVQGLKLGSKVKVIYRADDKERLLLVRLSRLPMVNGIGIGFDRSYRSQES